MLLGKEIRIQRLIREYSQEYMANRLDISQNAYSKIERGETDLSVRRMIQIAEILEIPATMLLPQSRASSSISLVGIKEWMLKARIWIHKKTGRLSNKITN